MWASRFVSSAAATGLLLASTFVTAAFADTDREWLQYRQEETKNAVIETDSEVFSGELSTPNEVRATPVIADGKIFVGNHDSGDLQAFDLSSGEQLWHAQAPNWVHSEMIYHDGRVYAGYGNRFFRESDLRGTGTSGVLCLDAQTGEEMWNYNTPGEVMPTPAVANGTVYIVTGDQHLYELDPQSGEELGVADIGHLVSMSSPAVADGTLYFGTGRPFPYTFLAYDTTAAEFAWSTEFPAFTAGLDDVPPAVADGIAVTTANRRLPDTADGEHRAEHVVIAMDTDTGDVIWQEDIGIGERPTNNRSGAPMIYDGAVFFGSPTTKRAYAYDLDTGEQLWSYDTGAIKGPPVAKDGTVFFSTTDGQLYAFTAQTGQKQGQLQLSEEPLAPAGPVIVNDTLVVASQDTNVYLLPIADVLAGGSSRGWIAGGIGVAVIALAVVLLIRPWQRRKAGAH